MPQATAPVAAAQVGAARRVRFARLVALLCAVLAVGVLAGWAFDIARLRTVLHGAVEMKANTAAGLLASSAALWRLTRWRQPGLDPATALLCALVGLLGLATLLEYALGWNAGLDELLFRDAAPVFRQPPGRMSPYTAGAFVALAAAMACVPSARLSHVARAGSALVAAIGMLAAIGYAWNVSEIVTDRITAPVAVHTALAFVLLGVAVYLLADAAGAANGPGGRSRLESLVLGGFVPTAVFVAVGGGFIYVTGANYADTVRLVAHTQEVRAVLGRSYGAIADAEFSTHHKLPNDPPAVDNELTASRSDSLDTIARLRLLLADNPAQLRLLARLEDLVSEHLRALTSATAATRQRGSDPVRQAFSMDARQDMLRHIRGLVQQMDLAEVALLESRLQRAAAQRRATILALLTTLTVLTAMFLLLFRSIRKEVAARNRVDEDLQRLNADLEQRVQERTQQLEHQQSFLRRVIDLNPNLIFAKDAQGRFVLANASMASAYGTTVDALVGLTDSDLNPDPEQVRGYQDADARVIASGRDLVVPEEQITTATGQRRWLSTVKRPMLSIDGRTTILLGVSTDITERKAAADSLRQMAMTLERHVELRTLELQEANAKLVQARIESDTASRAKSAFLANMSHEIRTPMNAIIGLTHLMLRATRDQMQRERLDKIGSAAQHLLQVINDILDLSKIEAGKLSLEDAEFSLDELLTRVTELVAPQGRSKGLEMIVDQEHLPRRLRGDATRLAQIIINLMANAVKFTEHGWVRLRGELLERRGERLLLRFEVQDTGPGISEDRQAALFSAFEQADNSSSRRHGGTGLGLALSRQLARAMGGEAGVRSAPGSGSLFWFTAWLIQGSAAPEPEAPVALSGLRALVVDDLPEALAAMGERLAALGLEVDAVDSGEAAVRKVQEATAARRSYDVVLIDWRMEPLDGLQTQERLRALLGEGMPPSILVTAFDEASLVERARAARFDAVMLKPLSISSLQDQLGALLRRDPRAEDAELRPASGTERLLQSRHAGQRVLLAEDNPVNREVAQALLEAVDLMVEGAWDGGSAVEMALSRPYDLILMDVQMPVMDGLEATQAIRKALGSAVPIIAMTANAFVDDRQACLEAGMNDHIAKPVDPERMYATLLRWLPLRAREPFGAAADAGAPPAVGVPALRERLAALQSIDVAVALQYVSGQEPILERTLRSFVATYRQGLPGLQGADGGEADTRSQWRKVCHSVRGALTTVGAAPLLARLAAFEARLAAGEPVAELAPLGQGLHQEMLALVEALEGALKGAPPGAPGPAAS